MGDENNKSNEVKLGTPDIFKNISDMLIDFDTTIAETFRVNFEAIGESLRDIGNLLDNMYDVDMSVYEKMGSLGWNFSDELPIDYVHQFVKEIERNINNDEEINNAFINL